MRLRLDRRIAGAIALATVLLMLLLTSATAQVGKESMEPLTNIEAGTANVAVVQEYAIDLAAGRYDLQPPMAWPEGKYNQSLDYVEGGRYYVAFYESGGAVIWVTVIDLDNSWYYREDVTWDYFHAMEMDPAEVVRQAMREDGLEWGRNVTIPDPSWSEGSYENSSADFRDGLYIVNYVVNGKAAWVSIASMDNYEDWYLFHEGGSPSKGSYQVDMTWREFQDSQLYSRG